MKPVAITVALSFIALTAAAPAALAEDRAAPTMVEVQPTPADDDEWVEFANPTPVDVSPEGLYLTDHDACFAPGQGFVDEYRWPVEVTVPAQDRLVVDLPDAGSCLTLADGGDELALEDEEGNELQAVSYGPEGDHGVPGPSQSLAACHAGALVHGNWSLAGATPGVANPSCGLAAR
jgi:hypothetical protein